MLDFSSIVTSLVGGVAKSLFGGGESSGGRGGGSSQLAYKSFLQSAVAKQKRYAEDLRKMGGVYDSPPRTTRPSRKKSVAMDRYREEINRVSNNNPYFAEYVRYSKGRAPRQPQEVSDTLTGTEASMFSEAETRKTNKFVSI